MYGRGESERVKAANMGAKISGPVPCASDLAPKSAPCTAPCSCSAELLDLIALRVGSDMRPRMPTLSAIHTAVLLSANASITSRAPCASSASTRTRFSPRRWRRGRSRRTCDTSPPTPTTISTAELSATPKDTLICRYCIRRSMSPSCTTPTTIMTAVSVRKRRLRMTIRHVEARPESAPVSAAAAAAAEALASALDAAVVVSGMAKTTQRRLAAAKTGRVQVICWIVRRLLMRGPTKMPHAKLAVTRPIVEARRDGGMRSAVKATARLTLSTAAVATWAGNHQRMLITLLALRKNTASGRTDKTDEANMKGFRPS
mmetsp:Transcript_31122/g.73984  ORF Transcript_31122/g.73984 Transcript_31122/m.73984 type:complete len:316 (-) Transcript_31122:568-1515(-)